MLIQCQTLHSVIVTFGAELITLEFGFEEIVFLSFESDQPFGVKLGGPCPSGHEATKHLPWASDHTSSSSLVISESQRSPPPRPPSPGFTSSLTICSSDQVELPFVGYRYKKQRNKCG